MDKEKILQELQPIFHDVFDDESIVVTESTNAAQIEDWDSPRKSGWLSLSKNIFLSSSISASYKL